MHVYKNIKDARKYTVLFVGRTILVTYLFSHLVIDKKF